MMLAICFMTIGCKKTNTDPGTGGTPPSTPAAKDVPQLDDAVTNFMTKYKIPGMSVTVTKDDKLIYAKSYGQSDKEAGTSAKNSDLYRLASVSKPITSIAIMKLIEAGKLNLEDKVFGNGALLGTSYGTKTYSDFLKAITVKHLLTHTEGAWGNSNNDPMFTDPSWSTDQVINWALDNIPVTKTPGTVYDYSNFGYCLLGRIIEKVSGQTYEAYVKKTVLEPAGISDMRIGGNTLAQRVSNEVKYYGQGGENPYAYNITRMDAHGGWLATATDLARLLVKVDGFSGKADMLSSSSITTMTTASSANQYYALGWSVNSAGNWWHSGSLPGTFTEIVRTSTGYTWTILCNTRQTNNSFATEFDGLMWTVINNPNTKWPDQDLF